MQSTMAMPDRETRIIVTTIIEDTIKKKYGHMIEDMADYIYEAISQYIKEDY